MSLVSSAIPNLVNGVSQQPFVQRLTSQGQIQLNGYSSLVEGLRKRPPSVHLAKVLSSPLANAYVHTINRSATEQYTVIMDGSSVYVFDMLGNPRTVNFPNGKAYCTTPYPPQNVFAATSVADYTFITNKNVGAAALSAVVPTRPYEAVIWVREADYDTPYTLNVNGRQVTYNTPDSSQAFNAAGIATTYVCNVLFNGLTGTPTLNGWTSQAVTETGTALTTTNTPGLVLTNIGSSIYISSTSPLNITASDGQGNTAIVINPGVNMGTVQAFANLPAQCINGFVAEIDGLGNSGVNGNYWVVYQASSQDQYGGVWVECAKPGEQYELDPSTMPYQLVRNSDGTFTFQQATWAPRNVGSLASCPFPSFVGQAINAVFFYMDRLGFLAGENVIMSQTGQFFNFTRTTALQLLDTDPIDLGSTSTQASTLYAAVPFQGTLLLFSANVQFQLTYYNVLSPNFVSINTSTNYFADPGAIPVGAEANVYFPFSRGNFAGVREYYLDGAGRINQANDVTSHVPNYIPGGARKLTCATNESCLVALSTADYTSLFVYRYYWQAGQKLQSSWSQWQMEPGTAILNAEFIQNNLYLVISRADGVYLEFINIQPGYVESGLPYLVHLDRKVNNTECTVSYNSTTNQTSITLPYAPLNWAAMQCVVQPADATYKTGRLLPMTSVSAASFTVLGHVTSFYVGVSYTFQYRFSTFIVREPVPMTYSMQAVTEGRLQIRNALLNYANSGYFRVQVTPYARSQSTYVYTAKHLGDVGTVFGGVPINTGVFRFPVQTQNLYAQIDVINDSFLPCFFESAGWEGFFILRSQRR